VTDCSLPEAVPEYDPEFLVEIWLVQANAAPNAFQVDRLARYVPEVGWASILAVLEQPDALPLASDLANSLEKLISQHGARFIDRIEAEARVSPAFKTCLGHIHPSPTFPIPKSLWERLSEAASASVGPMTPHMEALYADLKGLDRAANFDPHPMDAADATQLTSEELRIQAVHWVQYHQAMWAAFELSRLVHEDPETAWTLILTLSERGDDHALGSLGAGDLEDLLRLHGHAFIDRIELAAKTSDRFRIALSHVWQAGTPEEQWQRVRRACGDEPQRG
jgi:Family of unknown function (DUF6869)